MFAPKAQQFRQWMAKETGEGDHSMRKDDVEQEYFTVSQVCRYLGISRATFYRHGLSQFGFPIGGHWRIRLNDVIDHYERQLEPGDSTEEGGK